MKFVLWFCLLCVHFYVVTDASAGLEGFGRTRTLEQHLQEDERFVAFNQKTGFIEKLQNESLDKIPSLRLDEIEKKQLNLAKNLQLRIQKRNIWIEKDKVTGQPIGNTTLYRLVNILNEKQEADLRISSYDLGNDFIYSRDNFLNTISATTAPFIPFSTGPDDLGTVSIEIKRGKEYSKIVWIDHNLFFELTTIDIDEKYLMDIAYWIQSQVLRNDE